MIYSGSGYEVVGIRIQILPMLFKCIWKLYYFIFHTTGLQNKYFSPESTDLKLEIKFYLSALSFLLDKDPEHICPDPDSQHSY